MFYTYIDMENSRFLSAFTNGSQRAVDESSGDVQIRRAFFHIV
jgi:hypothetical protein